MNVCPHCHIGRIQHREVNYVCWLDGHIMVVPRTPAYVCDVCDNLEYDSDFMLGVRYLIHQHEVTHKRPPRAQPKKVTGKPAKSTDLAPA